MRIANPTYDAAFKYMLTNDERVAKLILSKLIGKEIIELHVEPTEILTKKERRNSKVGRKATYTVMRLDFVAKVKYDDNDGNSREELLIIEMQKAKLITDIMRFRKYLGSQYMNEKHCYVVNGKKIALSIYPIYFLGHNLDEPSSAAFEINKELRDAITGEKIAKLPSNFIDALFHDGLIIQIPRVKSNLKSNCEHAVNRHLEELLAIFDQTNCVKKDRNYLELDPDKLPKWLKPILRSLEKAGQDKEIQDRMQMEDDYIADLEDLERQIENKDKTLEQNAKELEQNAKELEQNAKELEQNAKDLECSIMVIMKISGCNRAEAIKQIKSSTDERR